MIFGLPVTGLGGLFYLILTLWMPVREAHRTVRGEGCPRRWKQIFVSCALMFFLFATMYAQASLISSLFPTISAVSSESLGTARFDQLAGSKAGGLVAGAMFVALITLACVALAVHALRLTMMVMPQRRRLATAQQA